MSTPFVYSAEEQSSVGNESDNTYYQEQTDYYNTNEVDNQKKEPLENTLPIKGNILDNEFNIENMPESDDYYSKETGEYYDEDGSYAGLYNSQTGDYYDKNGSYVGRYNQGTGEYFNKEGEYVGRYDKNNGEYYNKEGQFIGRFDKVLNKYFDSTGNSVRRSDLTKKLEVLTN